MSMNISWKCCVASCLLGFVFSTLLISVAIVMLPDDSSTMVICNNEI
jgi:hypothetical protein